MNRALLFGIAIFFAVVGIALVGGDNKVMAGHGHGGCGGGCGGYYGCDGGACGGAPACCGPQACSGRHHRHRHHHHRRNNCCGNPCANPCCGPVAPACCGQVAPTCGGAQGGMAPQGMAPGNEPGVAPEPPVSPEPPATEPGSARIERSRARLVHFRR